MLVCYPVFKNPLSTEIQVSSSKYLSLIGTDQNYISVIDKPQYQVDAKLIITTYDSQILGYVPTPLVRYIIERECVTPSLDDDDFVLLRLSPFQNI